METISVGVRDAKARLSKLLKRVQQGEEVLLKDRGRPIARIVPIESDRLDLPQRIRQLEDRGVIEPLQGKRHTRLPELIPDPEGLAQQFLQHDRDNEPG